jgi:two-component system sensor histidine kinase and response regulator WspE
MELPFSSVPASAGAHAQGAAVLPRRVLVVDDDVAILQLSQHALVKSGYDVNAVVDGAAGWAALRSDHYDLLITDHNMPKISGVELVAKVRSAGMPLPVILATGTLPKELLQRHPDLGLAATLLKPFTIDELLGVVRETLRTASSQRAPQPLRPSTLA